MRACVIALTILVCSGPVLAGYDAHGFEPGMFAPGALNGQDGWRAGRDFDNYGVMPQVVTAPDPTRGAHSVRLEIGDHEDAASWMERELDGDLLAGGNTLITVSFDIYREPNASGRLLNLWWYWLDPGTPSIGLQWHALQQTRPFGFSGGAGGAPTVTGRWATVRMQWDFATGCASSWYDGQPVDVCVPINPPGAPAFDVLTGWGIELRNDVATGLGPDAAWIDNVVITAVPEPAAGGLLVAVLALLRRRLR